MAGPSEHLTSEGLEAEIARIREREAATRKVLQLIRNSRDNEGPVLDAILESASRLCHAPMAVLGMITPDEQHYTVTAHHGMKPEVVEYLRANPPELDPDKYVAARAMVEARSIHVDDLADPNLYGAGEEARLESVRTEGIRTAFCVPLVLQDKVIGSLFLYRRVVSPFQEDEIALVSAFAEQAVIAIENARQFREVQDRLERETATRDVLEVINQSREDDAPVFNAILESAARLCQAPLAFAAMVNDAGTHLEFKGSKGEGFVPFIDYITENPIPLDPELTGTARAIRDCKTVAYADYRAGPEAARGSQISSAAVNLARARSLIDVPLVRDGVGIGVIILWRTEVDPFSRDEIALVETFAAQAVIAIENVRQFREVQDRLEREHASAEILQVISKSRDDEAPIFQVILENAAHLCGAIRARLMLTNDDATQLIIVATWGQPNPTMPEGMVIDMQEDIIPTRAVRDRQVLNVPDARESPGYKAGNPISVRTTDGSNTRSVLAVPLTKGDEVFGCIAISDPKIGAFDQSDVLLVQTFAAQAVIAIENVRQFREVQARLERETATSDVLQVISQSRSDDAPVFEAILSNAARLCRAEMAWLLLLNEDRSEMHLAAYHGLTRRALRIGQTWPLIWEGELSGLGTALADARTVQDEDLRQSRGYLNGEPDMMQLVDEEGLRTRLSVPLVSDGQAIGVIVLSRREVLPFSDDDVRLVDTFAGQAVIAIENVRQFKALETLNAELGDRVEAQVGEIERMGKLKRFLPTAVADTVISSGSEKMLSSHRALLGVLFCDIRGFTAFCETAEPEETIEVLQTYHEEMGKLINAYGAGVDHRMGDGIMVLFNDPVPCDDPAGAAVRLAIAMRAQMADLCTRWKRLGHRLGFGVGVSLGYATVGMVGFEGRFDYTASGTAVNLAARLCDEAEDGEILLSPRAGVAIEDDFEIQSKGELVLKGIREPLEVFKLAGVAPASMRSID